MNGKKILGVVIIVLLLLGLYFAIQVLGSLIAIMTTPLGMIVLGLVLLGGSFILYRLLKWCFS